MSALDILNFSVDVVGACAPFFKVFLPCSIALCFVATVPDILRKVIGVR
jgi:hypothetical protein